MRLDTAAFKCCIIKWKIGFAPGAMAAGIIAFNSTARTATESTTSSLIVFLVRHVAAAASKTREVNTGAVKSALITWSTRWASQSVRSAQIRGAVSVHQETLDVQVRRVRWSCMWVIWCCCNCSGVRATTVVLQWRSWQGAAVKTNASCVHSSGDRRL
jgi:hypothetical protein